jgi:hypothetical protein
MLLLPVGNSRQRVERSAVDIFEEALNTWNRWLEEWYFKESSLHVVGKPLNRP